MWWLVLGCVPGFPAAPGFLDNPGHDFDEDGFTEGEGDCDDARGETWPGAPEICDGLDNDCDGEMDWPMPEDAPSWYADSDGDGYGVAAYVVVQCNQPEGFVGVAGDCDDTDALSSPGGAEVCDGYDNDCDGLVDALDDDMVGEATWYLDLDADGHGDLAESVNQCEGPAGYVRTGDDCDDSNPLVYTGAEETCDGLDNDCDDLVDDDDPDMTGPATWYRDADHDGYGVADNTLESCTQPTGYVALGTDCDDANDWIHPSQLESCDGVDENCDGTIDEGVTTRYYLDADSDGYGLLTTWVDACDHPSGYVENADDCNDADALAWMGGVETCDGSDNDCDGTTDPTDSAGCVQYYYDYDGDGYGLSNMNTCECSGSGYYTATESGDCDDADALVNSGAGNCGLMGTIDVSAADGVFTASGAASDLGEWGTIAGGEDLNQDGWADLVFSSPDANSYTGEIYVSYGPHTGGAIDLSVHADVTLAGSGPGAYAGGGGKCIK